MGEEKSSSEFGDGVFFRSEDYASFLRRALATLVDFVVLLIAGVVVGALILYLFYDLELSPDSSQQSYENWFHVCWALIVWCYLAICKPTSFRTIGYRAAGLKIVTLKGTKVPWYQMTCRLVLWMFGPFSLLMDTVWVFTDEARQSCRDSYCGTLVVRNTAVPQGRGPIKLTFFNAFGMTLMYKRAKVTEQSTG